MRESRRNALAPEQWKAFGRRLTEAMDSDNEGVQRSARRLAAYHGDRLQMGRSATISAVKLYRDDPHPYVRKLAVVAIARNNHPWGIDFLTRSLAFEDSGGVEKVMRSMLQERSTENPITRSESGWSKRSVEPRRIRRFAAARRIDRLKARFDHLRRWCSALSMHTDDNDAVI